MSFTSISFFIFIFFTILLYYIVPKKLQWVILLISSYIFYLSSGVKLVAFLLFTTVTTFFSALFIGKLNEKYVMECKYLDTEQKSGLSLRNKKKKKAIVTIAILLNFTLLFFLKYYNFTIEGLNNLFALFSTNILFPKINLLLPLGISFYMFQSIGYVIDVYRGKYEPDRNFFKFSLFVSFFPQIIQGPISRYDNLAHQLYGEHKLNFDNLKYGIELLMWGYFKKLVIADRAVVVVNYVFDNYFGLNGAMIAIGVMFYCIQLYCDFSGGIDITRGIAKIFGIDLTENFRRPYYAISLSDFWRRWHITLGTWMKDYLFYPISLSKAFGKFGKFSRKNIGGMLGKILPTSIASFIVFFTIGIWHGGSSKYIFFGLWNGLIIMLSILLQPIYKKMADAFHINLESTAWYIVRIIRTTFIVFIGRYFTRATSLAAAISMLKITFSNFSLTSMFNLANWELIGLNASDYVIILIAFLVVLVFGAIEEKGVDIRKSLEKKNAFVQFISILVCMIVLIVFGIYRGDTISSDFIYKQF